MKKRILLIDADPDVRGLLQRRLSEAGYEVAVAADGVRGLQAVQSQPPDLVLLDVTLPGVDGFEICRRLRRDAGTATLPFIFVSGRADEMDRIVGFELGADDYVAKPFSARELLLRIRRTLERTKSPSSESVISCGRLLIDLSRHEVTIDGQRVTLTTTEFKLLEVMARRTGCLYSRPRLLKEVWNYDDSAFDSRTVDTHVRRLREKMGTAAQHIETVRGAGYRFIRDV